MGERGVGGVLKMEEEGDMFFLERRRKWRKCLLIAATWSMSIHFLISHRSTDFFFFFLNHPSVNEGKGERTVFSLTRLAA